MKLAASAWLDRFIATHTTQHLYAGKDTLGQSLVFTTALVVPCNGT